MGDLNEIIERVESLTPCERKVWDLCESQSNHYDDWRASLPSGHQLLEHADRIETVLVVAYEKTGS